MFQEAARAHLQEGCSSFLLCITHRPTLAQVHGASAASGDSSPGSCLPAALCGPMGFAASASWAQRFNEVVAEDATLPPSRRVVADSPTTHAPATSQCGPASWMISGLEGEIVDGSAPWGQMLRDRVGVCWDTHGLAANVKKDVPGELTGEVQGAIVHGTGFWRGLSRSKHVLRTYCYKRVCTFCHAGMSGFA